MQLAQLQLPRSSVGNFRPRAPTCSSLRASGVDCLPRSTAPTVVLGIDLLTRKRAMMRALTRRHGWGRSYNEAIGLTRGQVFVFRLLLEAKIHPHTAQYRGSTGRICAAGSGDPVMDPKCRVGWRCAVPLVASVTLGGSNRGCASHPNDHCSTRVIAPE